MTAERWQQVKTIFQRAAECDPAARTAFLRESCGDDADLRREVESLLASEQHPGSLLDNPVLAAGAVAAAAPPNRTGPINPIHPGAVLPERYEILAELGRGGMGIVYKARDRETGEVLALKILKPEIAADLQIIERFKNELRLAHRITHHNVARLYEFHRAGDTVYVSMEYVEGESLCALLHRTGKLDVAHGLAIARQLAAGVAEAHRQSIAHRDLKPENIMLTAAGEVKVLDFGISRFYAANATATTGFIGTPAYMAPEQAEGTLTDHRTDIYALGLVLYEMFTGTKAFTGDTPVSLALKQVRESPPPPRTLAPLLPVHVEHAILKCLEKDPADRFQSVEDLMRALAGEHFATVRRPGLSPWLLGAVAAILTGAVIYYPRLKAPALLAQPIHRQVTFIGDAAFPSISPDGKSVAYVTGKPGQEQRLMVQDVQGGGALELAKAAVLANPKWSPDGSELDVWSDGPRRGVSVIPRLGGSSRFIAEGGFTCWSPDGRQLAMAKQTERGFRVVDKVTGSVKKIPLTGFQNWRDLDWSPATNLLAIWVELENGRNAIWTVRPDGSRQHQVIEQDALASPRWSATGDEIYFQSGKGDTSEISKVSINPKSGEANGPASVLLSGLQIGDYFTKSADGLRIAYSRAQKYSNLWSTELEGSDKGKEMLSRPLTSGTSEFHSPGISPDGKWIAFAAGQTIYKLPIEGGTHPELTLSEAFHARGIAWSPDGKRIAFGSDAGGAFRVWIVDADGSNRRQLAKTQLSAECGITWAPGRNILYQRPKNRNFTLLDPDSGEEKPLLPDEPVGLMFHPKYSPDGKKIAVYWNRMLHAGDRQAEYRIWVISLLDNSATSLSENLAPAGWSPDERWLYAFPYPWNGNSVLSVSTTGVGSPRTLFTLPGDIDEAVVSSDGRKIISIVAEAKSDVWLVENFDHKK
jgi:eukaryotic-like serine/threonine-protein kinase